MKPQKFIAAALLMLGLCSAANATLLSGKTVSFQYYFPDLSSAYSGSANGNYLVGDGVEISNVVENQAWMDISDSNLYIGFPPPAFSFIPPESSFSFGDFNGFVISDVFGTIDAFTSVTINSATNLAGFDASRISFDSDHIWVDWNGLGYLMGTTVVSLDINHTEGHESVPEPASLALIGLALVGLAALRRRN